MPVINDIFTPGTSFAEDTFKLFIAYENQPALSRAENLQRHLSKNCKGEIQIDSNAWNFSLLGYSRLRKRAAMEAASSDMIVISTQEVTGLSSPVLAWIRALLAQRQNARSALVVLLDPTEGAAEKHHEVTRYLRKVAATKGLDFFCNRDHSGQTVASLGSRPKARRKSPRGGMSCFKKPRGFRVRLKRGHSMSHR